MYVFAGVSLPAMARACVGMNFGEIFSRDESKLKAHPFRMESELVIVVVARSSLLTSVSVSQFSTRITVARLAINGCFIPNGSY